MIECIRMGVRAGRRKLALPVVALLLSLGLPGMHAVGDARAQDAAATASEVRTPAKRPKIGLVLAGGGAKGAAHVGVLKVLEEMRVPVDFIAGTSMGSVVGGLYASGMSPQAIEQEIRRIDWVDVFEDDPDREDRSFRRKADDYIYVFKVKPGFNEGEVRLPLAYVHGQKFDLQLNRLTLPVSEVRDFDRLPIPYRAVATNLETGQEVVLKSGKLARAIRASMAVPGAFDPVEIDDKLLIDGGIANNVPVSVARAMGADVVIVSDLGSDLFTRDQITSALDVAGQMVNFLFALNSVAQLKSLGPQDVHIVSKLGDIGAASFDRIKEAIPVGEQAARQAADSLRRYALSEADYRAHVALRSKPRGELPAVAFVRIVNDSGVGDDVIASQLSVKPGQALDIARLEKDIQQIYGLELFESVRYELVDDDGGTGVIIRAKEKPWGPGYLQAGMIASSNFDGESTFRLGMTYTLTQINRLNGEWRVGAQVGDEPALYTEVFQPLDPAARYFVHGFGGYVSRAVNLFDASGENKVGEAFAQGFALEAGIGKQIDTWGEVRLGYRRETGSIEFSGGPPRPDQDYDSGYLFVRLMDDKLDNVYFPTRGHLGRAEYRASRTGFGADTDYDQATFGYNHVFNWGRNTLVGGLSLRTTLDGAAPTEGLYRLGGFLNLSGYQQDSLSGQQAGLARAVYLRRLTDFQFFKAYVGASVEVGNVWQDTGDIGFDDTVLAGAVYLGADTPIGPVYLGYGHNDRQEGSLYLYLGPLFSF
jgi:NTE family protein